MGTSSQLAVVTRRAGRRTTARWLIGWALFFPAALILAAGAVLPTLVTIGQSLFVVTLTGGHFAYRWDGVQNYLRLLGSGEFRQAVGFTMFFTAVTVAAELLVGMGMALAANMAIPGKNVLRTMMLVPWALITVVSAQLWRYIYDGTYGVANAVLVGLHVIAQPVTWLSDDNLAIGAMMVADIWKTAPFVALLLLAGLQTIPSELHEAASIDGASPWQVFHFVTLPLLRPSVLLAALYRTIQAFVGLFDLPFVLTGGGPGYATQSVAIYSWKRMFQDLLFGQGAAASVVAFAVTLLLAIVYIRMISPRTISAESP